MSHKRIVQVGGGICLVAVLLAVGWRDAPVALAQAPRADGRYLLFQGRYVINSKGASIDESAVFKIDTQTGTVSIYREGQMKDGQMFSEFTKIPDR